MTRTAERAVFALLCLLLLGLLAVQRSLPEEWARVGSVSVTIDGNPAARASVYSSDDRLLVTIDDLGENYLIRGGGSLWIPSGKIVTTPLGLRSWDLGAHSVRVTKNGKASGNPAVNLSTESIDFWDASGRQISIRPKGGRLPVGGLLSTGRGS